MNGWARRNELGDGALKEIELGLQEWRDTGCRLGLSFFLYLYADAAILHGHLELAEELLDEAEQITLGGGEQFWIVGLTRLRGRLALAQGHEEACIDHFEQAVSLALDRGHFGPLLRTIKELAKLDPTPDCLNRIKKAVEEVAGFDGPDLAETRAILSKLGTAKTESSSQDI